MHKEVLEKAFEKEAKLSQHEKGRFIDENKLAGLYDPLFERKDL